MRPNSDWVTITEFSKRFQIGSKMIYDALDAGVFKYKKKYNNVTYIYWPTSATEYMGWATREFEVDNATGYYRPKDKDKKPTEEELKKARKESHDRIHRKEVKKKINKFKNKNNDDFSTLDNEDENEEEVTLNSAKKQKEYYASLKAKMEYEVARGKLLDYFAVEKEWNDIAINLRKRIMGIADRICALIAGEVKLNRDNDQWFFDIDAAHAIITEECETALRTAFGKQEKTKQEDTEDINNEDTETSNNSNNSKDETEENENEEFEFVDEE